MTRAELIQSNTDNITAAGLVTKTRHSTFNLDAVDEIYSDTPTANTQAAAGSVLTPTGNNFNYSLYIVKQGRVVYVTGTIQNATMGSLTPQNIASGLSGDFTPITDTFYRAFDTAGNQFNINFDSDGNLKLNGNVTNQNVYTVNAHYFTAN